MARKNREHHNKQQREQKNNRNKKGLCRHCLNERIKNSTMCEKHWYEDISSRHFGTTKREEFLKKLAEIQEYKCAYTDEVLLPAINMSLDHIISNHDDPSLSCPLHHLSSTMKIKPFKSIKHAKEEYVKDRLNGSRGHIGDFCYKHINKLYVQNNNKRCEYYCKHCEHFISKYTVPSYQYALHCLQNKFPLGEPVISTNAAYSYYYALNVLKDRFPLGEKTILKNVHYTYLYACDIIKNSWPEAENVLRKTHWWSFYKHKFHIK